MNRSAEPLYGRGSQEKIMPLSIGFLFSFLPFVMNKGRELVGSHMIDAGAARIGLDS
jgi:hypothetical protein